LDFPLKGWNPKVSLPLARLVKLLVDDGKRLSVRGNELKNNCVDYSVGEL
jgi:hypothetical protein